MPHIDSQRAAGKPVLILVDVRNLGKISTATRRFAVNTLTTIAYDRIAIYGATVFNKALINLIAHAAGKSRQVQVFASQQTAENWLESYARKK